MIEFKYGALHGKTPKFGGIIQESPGIRLVDKKRGLRDKSNSEHDFEVNF